MLTRGNNPVYYPSQRQLFDNLVKVYIYVEHFIYIILITNCFLLDEYIIGYFMQQVMATAS